MELSERIEPFYWIDFKGGASVNLEVGEYLQEVFDTREDEGFVGNGYDWGSLADVFLAEKHPELVDKIKFDSESGTFCAYSDNIEALTDFIIEFKAACEDRALILDLFSRAEID